MTPVPAPKLEDSLRENEKKWTKTLMDAGWTALPSVILERQKAFRLDAVDMNILMHLACRWWYASKLPYPGKRMIADAMGISSRTVQRRIAQMEADGLIKRIQRWHPKYGRQTNSYDFSGLIESAKPYAEELIEARRVAREERESRRKRKAARPPIRLAE